MDLQNEHIFDGLFGLERETLRVTDSGELSSRSHPFPENENLSRDFCENQLEIITPVYSDIPSLMRGLDVLDSAARSVLRPLGETLWLNSNPPKINGENDITVAKFNGNQAFKREYRLNLEHRYGKRLMLYSGIHFNFSFSERFLQSAYDGNGDYRDFKNALYLRLFKQVFRYGWLIALLTAASPVYDLSLDADGLSGSGFDGFASRRNGEKGYWNKLLPVLDYSGLDAYIASINRYIENGDLISADELYLPARVKSAVGGSLAENGINHIELRMFDLNPLSPLGIFQADLEFSHYFLIYLMSLPDFELTPAMQDGAVKSFKSAALYDLSEIEIDGQSAADAALDLLNNMSGYFKDFPQILENIDTQKKKITLNKRYCVTVYNELIDDFQGNMLNISKQLG